MSVEGVCWCGHAADVHDGGKCWVDAAGNEIWMPVEGKCSCDWYAPAVPR